MASMVGMVEEAAEKDVVEEAVVTVAAKAAEAAMVAVAAAEMEATEEDLEVR